MDKDFPSIWLEIRSHNSPIRLVCGFYREWTKNRDNSIGRQLESMKTFTKQIEQATRESNNIAIMGDANLDAMKWDEPKLKQKAISEELRDTLKQCGISEIQKGRTYQADRLNALTA